VGAAGTVLDVPAAFYGNADGASKGFLFPPILFARNALPSGPQACFREEEGIIKVKAVKARPQIDKEKLPG
jgi:hypothetical protein